MSPRNGPAAVNPDPAEHPDFKAGLEALGYLQDMDRSEERITARFQHGLEKANFAAHSEEFCGQQGVRKVHRSVVQFFHEEPSPIDPFVHVIVGTLPPDMPAHITPVGFDKESHWVPIRSRIEADGTRHFTVSIQGFWPITVVFDSNQAKLDRENSFARINPDDDSESDPEAYLDRGYARSTRRASSRSRRASGYGGVGRSSSRSSRRRYDYDDDDDEFSSEEEDFDAPPPRRGSVSHRSRRGSLPAVESLSLARSSSRASRSRRASSRQGSMY
ncbi:uncharacterized protein JCM15063_001590 [Sporobolomyces koalae]|uniref:uncharacterized protein n=1 Tax=Sporobolomyces koalae TaxID=500713 RepID=UPI00317E27BB